MPVPNEGKLQYSDRLKTYVWTGLYVDLIAASFDQDDADIEFGDLTIAAWAGYLQALMPSIGSPAIVTGPYAKTSTSGAASFTNGEAFSVTAYGYVVHDNTYIFNLQSYVTPVSIPAGQTLYQLIDFYLGNLVLP